mgnify:CR=1 FL=1
MLINIYKSISIRRLIGAAAAVVLLGCGATMVNSPGASHGSRYAPVNEAQRGGVIKYLNQGADSVIESRREDAYRQMYSACAGKYRIVGEGPRSEGGVVTPALGSLWASSYQYWYIQFNCER